MDRNRIIALALVILLAFGVNTAMGEEDSAATPPEAQPLVTPDAPDETKTTDDAGAVYTLGERILQFGMRGEDVAEVQRMLSGLGYDAGEADGIFGRQTRTAVLAFQRANGLNKIDGKVGPETLSRMFAGDVIVQVTPTPSPTPTPVPTPTPTPTPTPPPGPTPEPDIEKAPFEMGSIEMRIAGNPVKLLIGRSEAGDVLYPLCGVMMHLGFDCACDAGNFQLTRGTDGTEIALMTGGEDGLCEGAMGSVNGVIFLSDAQRQVYLYSGEAYVTQMLLELLGANVYLVDGTIAVD